MRATYIVNRKFHIADMPALEFLLLLALIQGLTEFLPISSSAHLILPAQIWGLDDQGLAFDVAVHTGTLLAVVIVMRRDLYEFAWQSIGLLKDRRRLTPDSPLVAVVIATIPVLVLGALFADVISSSLRSVAVIAWASIVFGLVLAGSEKFSRPGINYQSIKPTSALLIGLAQACALIPGASRSGTTMAACLWLGLDKKSTAEFSYLLAIPVILAATCYQGLQLYQQGISSQDLGALLICAIAAFISALMSMGLFLTLVTRIGYLPFAVYRILLGIVLLVFFV